MYARTGICTGTKSRFSHFLNKFKLAEVITDFFILGVYLWLDHLGFFDHFLRGLFTLDRTFRRNLGNFNPSGLTLGISYNDA